MNSRRKRKEIITRRRDETRWSGRESGRGVWEEEEEESELTGEVEVVVVVAEIGNRD